MVRHPVVQPARLRQNGSIVRTAVCVGAAVNPNRDTTMERFAYRYSSPPCSRSQAVCPKGTEPVRHTLWGWAIFQRGRGALRASSGRKSPSGSGSGTARCRGRKRLSPERGRPESGTSKAGHVALDRPGAGNGHCRTSDPTLPGGWTRGGSCARGATKPAYPPRAPAARALGKRRQSAGVGGEKSPSPPRGRAQRKPEAKRAVEHAKGANSLGNYASKRRLAPAQGLRCPGLMLSSLYAASTDGPKGVRYSVAKIVRLRRPLHSRNEYCR
jgi:hypothetical protein